MYKKMLWIIPIISLAMLVNNVNGATISDVRAGSNFKVKRAKKNVQPAVIDEDIEIWVDDEPYDNSSKELLVEHGTSKLVRFSKDIERIHITDPEIADINLISKNSFELVAQKGGRTKMMIYGKDRKIMFKKNISVSFDLSKILSVIYDMFPNNNISVVNFDNSIVLKGEVESPKVASDIIDTVSKLTDGEGNIINNMTIGTPAQVLLKVKIAKVSRDISKSLGINWKSLRLGAGISAAIIGGTSGGPVPAVLAGVVGTATETAPLANPALGTTTFISGNSLGGTPPTVPVKGGRWIIDYKDGNGNNIGGVIDALADESLATVLAEPTLVALSGESAKFTSGGEHPYKNNATGSSTTTTTQFKEWGVMLDFTPTVLSNNRIRIKVKPEVSAIEQAAAGGEPPLSKQSVETTVELGSGQSLAIAGLLKKEKSASASEIPGLSKLPLFGPLFRSSNNVTKETELIIIVTPYIVKPSSKPLSTPVDNVPKILSPCDSNIYNKFYLTDEDKAKQKCNIKRNVRCTPVNKKATCRQITEHSGFTIS